MKNQTILGKHLKEVREKKGISQKEFAESLGITAARLSSYETGVSYPPVILLTEIAKKNNLSLDWLMGLKDENSVNDSFKTLADLASIILALSNIADTPYSFFDYKIDEMGIERQRGKGNSLIRVHFFADEYNEYKNVNDDLKNSISFTSDSKAFNDFFSGLCKMKDLRDRKIIENSVFEAWIEKTLNELEKCEIL